MKTPLLVTIPFSHFCEKARWALQRAGVAFHESAHMPGFHRRATAKHGGTSVPVLVTDEGVLRESTDIVRWADARATKATTLFPAPHEAEIAALVARFDRELGPSTRLVAYHHLLPEPARLIKAVGSKFSAGERVVLRAFFPLIRPIMRKRMRITEASAQRAVEVVRALFREMDERLKGAFLVGDRFTAADLTFASLASPGVLPYGHAYFDSDPSSLPAPLRAFVDELRGTRSGAHVMAMYRAHRA